MTKLKQISIVFIFIFSLTLASCGTLYKTTFVKNTGKLDYYIVFLDSLGLLVFVFPGIIALGVDYATGTLFLTEEQEKSRDYPMSPDQMRSLILYKENTDTTNIQNLK